MAGLAYLQLGPRSRRQVKEVGCSRPPLSWCASSLPRQCYSVSGTQGGQHPHVLRFQALMFAPPSGSSCCKGSRGQRLTPGADTLLLPLHNTFTSCPIPRTGTGVPLSRGPHAYPHRAIYPMGSATEETDSQLNGVAGDGVATCVTGRGPRQDEAVPVHVQASDIQGGSWSPGLLGCSI